MGVLLPTSSAPSGQLPFTDGAYTDATRYLSVFPYVNQALPGSPNTLTPFMPFFESILVGNGNSDIYIYDQGLGSVLYTTGNLYPYIYDFKLNTYLYYFSGTENPRQFYNFASGTFFSN